MRAYGLRGSACLRLRGGESAALIGENALRTLTLTLTLTLKPTLTLKLPQVYAYGLV